MLISQAIQKYFSNMAKKGKNNSTPNTNNPTTKKTEIFQAVVIADGFDGKFSPLTNSLPRCLIPLANIPLIEYTLESLSFSGVQEAFLYCKANVEAFRSYIQ